MWYNMNCELFNVIAYIIADRFSFQTLSRIFSFCSVSDLKSCRLVGSHLWLNASSAAWREKAVLKIKGNDPHPSDRERLFSLKRRPNNPNDKLGVRFSELQRIYQEDLPLFNRLPFRNIKLDGLYRMEETQLSWIVETFPQLTRVIFSKCGFPNLSTFFDLIFRHLSNLTELVLIGGIWISNFVDYFIEEDSYTTHPNLKRLVLRNPALLMRRRPIPWDVLFRYAAFLEELRIVTSVPGYPEKAEKVKEILSAAQGRVRLKTLEISSFHPRRKEYVASSELAFGDMMPTPALPNENSNDAVMPLERFTGSVVDLIHLKPYSTTLKYLDIFVTGTNNSEEEILFLHLNEFIGKGSVNVNQMKTPLLETLRLDLDHVSKDMVKKIHNPSFANVTKFECFCNTDVEKRCPLGIEDIGALRRSMPNLAHLKLPVTGNGFSEICRTWPNLLTLTVLESQTTDKVLDEHILGIQACDNFEEVGRRPNIRDMKRLTDFVNPYLMWDLGANFGLLRLPRLHYLSVRFSEISEETVTALEKKVQVLEIQQVEKMKVLYQQDRVQVDENRENVRIKRPRLTELQEVDSADF